MVRCLIRRRPQTHCILILAGRNIGWGRGAPPARHCHPVRANAVRAPPAPQSRTPETPHAVHVVPDIIHPVPETRRAPSVRDINTRPAQAIRRALCRRPDIMQPAVLRAGDAPARNRVASLGTVPGTGNIIHVRPTVRAPTTRPNP